MSITRVPDTFSSLLGLAPPTEKRIDMGNSPFDNKAASMKCLFGAGTNVPDAHIPLA